MPMSEYMRRLRQRVGSDLVLAPSVSVLVVDGEGRVLLVRHAETGRWVLPGGAVEPHELPADVAAREVWEEAGLTIEPVRVLGVYGGPEFVVRYRNGDEVAYVTTVFEGRVLGGEPRHDGVETLEARYVAREELASLDLAAWARRVLRDVSEDSGGTHFQPATWRPTPTDGVA